MYDKKALEEDDLDRTIQRLLIRAKDLEGFLKTYVNTKSDIKKAGADIYRISLKLNRRNKTKMKQNPLLS
nr:unnamed protein product [Callosobruchus analis]